MFTQTYDPFSNPLVSTLVASLPVLVLFYLLVVKRAHVPVAAAGGAVAALLAAVLCFHMSPQMAGLSFLSGALFGLMPICWTIICAMFLYNITVETGGFEKIKNSVAGLSADHRLQAILIAFAFGAFLEGAAGGGTPVAICAAMMVGLGFDPFLAAGLCLIANTSPVAYGGFGTPLLTLGVVTKIDPEILSKMAGNQLPFLSCIVPLWLVRSMCSWKETREVLPAIGVAGGSFALCQFFFAHSKAFALTDLAGGLISLVVTAVFLHYWKPKNIWRFEMYPERRFGSAKDEKAKAEKAKEAAKHSSPHGEVDAESIKPFVPAGKMTPKEVLWGWTPYMILCVLMVIVGTQKPIIDKWQMGPIHTAYNIEITGLHKQVQRTPPVVPEGEKPEDAIFKLNWATMPGTSILLTAFITLGLYRVTGAQLKKVVKRTADQMALPVPTIVCMLGMAYVTRYAGLDATMGLAFRHTGALYPFFAAILGWLGVFLTGTDAGSNALFGSLQLITATQLGLNPVLITVANSTGGVMGKMIDAQSICVATAATNRLGTEADIFKWVVWHSVVLASIVGLIVLLQAYVWPFTLMVPAMPIPVP